MGCVEKEKQQLTNKSEGMRARERKREGEREGERERKTERKREGQ